MFDLEPGVGLCAGLAGSVTEALSDEDLIAAIAAYERMASWVAAGQSELVNQLHRRCDRRREPGDPDGGEWASAEVAAALRMSRRAADGRVSLAWQLAERLPLTAAALRRGLIDLPRARAIADGTTHLDEAQARLVEERVLGRAEKQTPARLRDSVSRAALRVDPDSAERRRKRARREREVTFQPLPDGLAEVRLVTTAAAARACYDTIAAVGQARSGITDSRGVDERRADAAVALLLGAARDRSASNRPTSDALPSDVPSVDLPAHVPVQVQVTVSLASLVGLSEAPAELAGYGPVTPTVARELAATANATWRRLVTDPLSGELLDAGRTTYRPPAGLARFVRARDGRCRFPGCPTPARLADLDHTEPFPSGPTSAANLGALCRHHHRLKHQTTWQVMPTQGRGLRWRSPFGQVCETVPEPVEPALGLVTA